MNTPEISIIVPVYNTKPFLCQCLDSILFQSYSDFELILVDDGSTDGSYDVCKQYASNDSRITLLHQENSGQAKARNVALQHARGKYFFFVDSDDYLEQDTLETVYNEIGKTNSVCVYYQANIVDLKNNTIDIAFRYFDQPTFLFRNEYIKLLLQDIIGSQPCVAAFRRDLWRNVYFPEGRIYEDLAAIYQVAHNIDSNERVCFLNRPLYNYRMNSCSTTHSSKITVKQFHRYLAFKDRYEYSIDNMSVVQDECFNLMILCALGVVHSFARCNLRNDELNEVIDCIKSNRVTIKKNKKLCFQRKVLLLLVSVFPRTYYFIAKTVLR